jgi:hypothetical protein
MWRLCQFGGYCRGENHFFEELLEPGELSKVGKRPVRGTCR